jgi:hypothetical protein
MLDLACNRFVMTRPLTREQALQNHAFLEALEQTGNIRLAARQAGIQYGTVQHRRRHHPAFAQEIDAALALAHAQLQAGGGCRPPSAGRARDPSPTYRTRGGEGVVVRRSDGKLQLRAAQPGKLTRQCEQAFLAALSATANVRLSAAAAGASVAAFYRRRRRNPAFAREMRMALEMGYERLEMALLEGFEPGSYRDDAWRHNEPPPIPQMTANQALQLLYLHQKEARLIAEPEPIRRRPGESREAQSVRLSAMWEARQQRAREAFDVAEAERRAQGKPSGFGPKILPPPPALDQVTGWSKADPAKTPRDTSRALFGGWRLTDLEEG